MSSLPDSIPEPTCASGVGPGWWPIVEGLYEVLHDCDPDIVVDQVKEKSGSLRVYVTMSDNSKIGWDSLNEMIRVAEAISRRTCETCGAAGTWRGDGWQRVTYDPYENQRNENRKALQQKLHNEPITGDSSLGGPNQSLSPYDDDGGEEGRWPGVNG
jgi:hypothetical protein